MIVVTVGAGSSVGIVSMGLSARMMTNPAGATARTNGKSASTNVVPLVLIVGIITVVWNVICQSIVKHGSIVINESKVWDPTALTEEGKKPDPFLSLDWAEVAGGCDDLAWDAWTSTKDDTYTPVWDEFLPENGSVSAEDLLKPLCVELSDRDVIGYNNIALCQLNLTQSDLIPDTNGYNELTIYNCPCKDGINYIYYIKLKIYPVP
jgi:hypothetical protein